MENSKYFSNIVHMNDDHGVLCNGHVGQLSNFEADKVNCNKCKKFMEDSKALEVSRKHRKIREEEKKNAEKQSKEE